MIFSRFLQRRYSLMKDYLSELDRETKKALETFYGFSEGKSKVRRAAGDWNGTESLFLRQIPLLRLENSFRTAIDFRSGRKRKVEGNVFHRDSSIVNSGDSNDIIGFQLVSATLPWPACSLWGGKGAGAGIPLDRSIACLVAAIKAPTDLLPILLCLCGGLHTHLQLSGIEMPTVKYSQHRPNAIYDPSYGHETFGQTIWPQMKGLWCPFVTCCHCNVT